MESYFEQDLIWSAEATEHRGLQQSEPDETSRETTNTRYDSPSPSTFKAKQYSNPSQRSGGGWSPRCVPSEKSIDRDDDVSSNEPRDAEEKAGIDDRDLKLEPIVRSGILSDGGIPSGEESDQLSNTGEEADSAGETDSEDGAIDYGEDTGSPVVEHTSPERSYSLLARVHGALDVQESSSITISDDFSHPAKVEERQFLALRLTKEPTPERPAIPSGSSYALQDYQMQLMLLEQQNLKRLLMARQEQDLMAEMPSSNAPQASGLTLLQSAGDQDVSRKRRHSQFQLDKEILGLDVEELQRYITRLEQRAEDLGACATSKPQPAFAYRILYRILDWEQGSKASREMKDPKRKLSPPFFDPPEWIGSTTTGTLRCQVPVDNFDLFLEKNKDISFIVFKTYVTPHAMYQGVLAQKEVKPKIKIEESIKPITQELIEAIKASLTSKHEYEGLWDSFKNSGELLAPYLFVYHQRADWQAIRTLMQTSSEEQLTLVWNYILESQGDEFAAADACISGGNISARFAPYLCKPGDILVQRTGDTYRGCILKTWAKYRDISQKTRRQLMDLNAGASQSSWYGSGESSNKMSDEKITVESWTASAWHWEFDGNFQRKHQNLEFTVIADTITDSQASRDTKLLDQMSDTKNETMPIQDLKVYPLRFAPEDIVKQLRMRGKIFWQCRNRGFVSYEEKIMGQEPTFDERYMIDLKAYHSLHKSEWYGMNGIKGRLIDELGPEALKRDEFPDEKFEFLLPTTIKGFNMRRKKWYDLVPERVRDVAWNKEAFQKVVMNSKAKDLIQALVSNQLAVESDTAGTDLIAGKGNGLILLLHGSPGTGKTLTAESVAEIAEKPLYRVTCADIGTKAEDAEKYLESILHLGKLWGCVVLLDEADVFLEQRSLKDLERNALVSAFLRILEYYEGILILTTNRVGTFDEAFKSRVQLALHYPALGPCERLQVWQNFLNRFEKLKDETVETGDLRDNLEELSKEDMNGRQIRNALTTARQYAKWKGEKLNYAKLKDVIEIAGRFDKYLDKLHKGLTQDQLAQDEGLR